jgi:hypothetical protein
LSLPGFIQHPAGDNSLIAAPSPIKKIIEEKAIVRWWGKKWDGNVGTYMRKSCRKVKILFGDE